MGGHYPELKKSSPIDINPCMNVPSFSAWSKYVFLSPLNLFYMTELYFRAAVASSAKDAQGRKQTQTQTVGIELGEDKAEEEPLVLQELKVIDGSGKSGNRKKGNKRVPLFSNSSSRSYDR